MLCIDTLDTSHELVSTQQSLHLFGWSCHHKLKNANLLTIYDFLTFISIILQFLRLLLLIYDFLTYGLRGRPYSCEVCGRRYSKM